MGAPGRVPPPQRPRVGRVENRTTDAITGILFPLFRNPIIGHHQIGYLPEWALCDGRKVARTPLV